MKTLRFKLTASFLLITLVCISVIGIFGNVLLEGQFKKYVIGNLRQKNEEVLTTLESRYAAWGGNWDVSGLESIGMSALGDGLILRISTPDGAVVWDAMSHNSGMCAALLANMAENMRGRSLGAGSGYTEKSYPITVGGTSAGTVTIGYYGPYFYTNQDVRFLNTLNLLLFLAAAVTGMLALLLGNYLAKRLADPIARVTQTAGQISDGNYAARAEESSTTQEIVALTAAVNTLAQTLGRHEVLRKRLTADVAHELRTPLANLQSHLEAMLDGVWEPDARRLKGCYEETVRLSSIVNDLETLARYDGEAVHLQEERMDLSPLVGTVVSGFEKAFAKKHIQLTLDLTGQEVLGDRDKLAQILINLLSNALKYTPAGGRIDVTLTGDADSARISVADTGIGISPEDLPLIFERFYRADKSRNRATGGSGIGLAIAKSLAEAHGGTISTVSQPGRGSTFTVTLPKRISPNPAP